MDTMELDEVLDDPSILDQIDEDGEEVEELEPDEELEEEGEATIDLNGKEYTLAELKTLAAEYESLQEKLPTIKESERYIPLLQELSSNDLAKAAIYWGRQGYTPAQIVKGIYQTLEQSEQGNKTPEFSTIEEEYEWKLQQETAGIKKELNDIKSYFEQEGKQREFEKYAYQVSDTNSNVLFDAIGATGAHEYLSDGQGNISQEALAHLAQATKEIINHKDWRLHQLTPTQAKAIVVEAANRLYSKSMSQRPQTKSRPNAPKITPGNSPRGATKPQAGAKVRPEDFSKDDRKKLFNLL